MSGSSPGTRFTSGGPDLVLENHQRGTSRDFPLNQGLEMSGMFHNCLSD